MSIPAEIRRWVYLAVIVIVVIATVSFCQARRAAKEAKTERDLAVATGAALDRVSTETPKIRQEQAEKEKAVDQIEGSDTRLPDGYGARLECVRRGKRDSDS